MSRLRPLPPEERAARLQALRDSGVFGRQRLFVGKTENHDAVVALRDGQGRVRLRMRVEASGAAAIEFLDEAGTVIKTERH